MTIAPVEFWFVTGSQHLYGGEVLKQVAAHAEEIASALSMPTAPVVCKPVLTDPEAIRNLCLEANASKTCAGLILWMHTFSPAKMWISGLTQLRIPVCHLHTQYNRDLPWKSIDMDFMNLNQAAHGDREAGHLHARIGLARKVVVGHWSNPEVMERLNAWARVAKGWHDLQGAKFARLGDNMRSVAVTEGDKVSAEVTFGFSVNGYGVGDLVAKTRDVSERQVDELCREYADLYDLDPSLRPGGPMAGTLAEGARIELGLRAFLTEGDFKGFTTTFEDLHGLRQLPGLAVQRLMAEGYGFAAEGDWKTCALLRFMKVVAGDEGTSFMEDYTYHLDPSGYQVLGAHMLEICPSIAAGTPRLEVHPLGIGGKEDPVRLVFDARPGPAINVSLIDLGHRFRLVANKVEAVVPPALPNLPVARAVWECKPDFKTAAACWLYAGGAHHTGYSYGVSVEHLRDFAEIAGIECVVIEEGTTVHGLRNELRWNEASFR